MIVNDTVTSIGINSIMFPPDCTTSASASSKPTIGGESQELMKMHAVNLEEKGFEQVVKHFYGTKVTMMGLAYKKSIRYPHESLSIKSLKIRTARGRGESV